MSEFQVEIVRLGKVGKHPNADRLGITTVHGKPVIFTLGEYQAGDLAAYVPLDSLVDTSRPEFSWLAAKSTVSGIHRVKLQKLRNVPSYGFLVPVSANHALEGLEAGTNVQSVLGITKYDPGPCYHQGGEIAGNWFGGPVAGMVPAYDIQALKRYGDLFQPGEHVWVSEKIHGSNGRWCHIDGKFYAGSRNKFRENSVWNRIAVRYNLESILGLPENVGLVVYGEVFGPGIQDLTYGLSEPDLRVFDVYSTKTGRWFDVPEFRDFIDRTGLPCVPTLYWGPYDAATISALSEGVSILAPDQVREGIVVKPFHERWDEKIGRVFLKLAGEGYLLRKEGK